MLIEPGIYKEEILVKKNRAIEIEHIPESEKEKQLTTMEKNSVDPRENVSLNTRDQTLENTVKRFQSKIEKNSTLQ